MIDENSYELLQEELWDRYIDIPEELTKQIENVAEETARTLRFRPDGAWMRFQGPDDEEPRLFKVQYRKKIDSFKTVFLIVIADVHKLEEAHSRNAQYAPYTMQVESNTTLDEVSQLKASLEAFLRHISGAVQPGEVDDE